MPRISYGGTHHLACKLRSNSPIVLELPPENVGHQLSNRGTLKNGAESSIFFQKSNVLETHLVKIKYLITGKMLIDRMQDSLYNKSSVLLDLIELRTRLNQFEIFVEY